MEEFAKALTVKESVFLFLYGADDLRRMNAFYVFERILLVAFVQSRETDAVMFRGSTQGFPSTLSLIKRVTNGKLSTDPQPCAKKFVVEPTFREAITPADYGQIRTLVTQKYQNQTDTVFVNPSPILEPLFQIPGNRFVRLPGSDDLKGIAKNVSMASGMVSLDDGSNIISAFWLPPEVPLLIVLPPKRRGYSPAVGRLLAAERRIIAIEGEIEGAISKDPELFMKCVGDVIPAGSKDCDPAYDDLVFTVDSKKILAAFPPKDSPA
jgi:hypothetical protein